jgi:hypothetical protein
MCAVLSALSLLILPGRAHAKDVDLQPLAAQATRVADAMDALGSPLAADDRKALEAAAKADDHAKGVEAIQKVLDRYCLVFVNINPEARVKVARGPAEAALVEAGWRTFLVKVTNEAGVTAELKVASPSALPIAGSPAGDVTNRWLEIISHTAQPMQKTLSGWESSIGLSPSTAATPASARRSWRSTPATARRTSVSAPNWTCSSPLRPRQP